MGRRSHSDRNILKHKKKVKTATNSNEIECNTTSVISDKLPIQETSNDLLSGDQRLTLNSVLKGSIGKPVTQQDDMYLHLKPTTTIQSHNKFIDASILDCETTRTMLKKAQRECIGHIKCIYSRRNVAAISPDDLTATDPMLNVIHILHHNCVPVPTHWRLRNGRFLTEHVPKYAVASKHQNVYKMAPFATKLYNPKDVFAQFQRFNKDIQQCNTSPSVDISYENRKNWVTIPLLSHGDLYHEARSSIICRSTYSPGTLSDELREALNIQPNDPPPWLPRQSLLPKPPWLHDISIATLNVSTSKQDTSLLRF